MITVNSASVMGFDQEYGIAEGKQADLVVLNAVSEMDAIRLLPECLWVIRKGKVIASTSPARTRVELGGKSEQVEFKRGDKA
jgi:cytosine deaminase